MLRSSQHSLNPIGEPCYIASPGPSGLDKRQFTLHLCIRADGKQLMRPMLMFRGKGEILPSEKALLDACKNINYCWANSEYSLGWLDLFSKCTDAVGGFHILFLDALEAQLGDEMMDRALERKIIIQKIPGGCTDLLQSVDHRVAARIKRLLQIAYKNALKQNYKG